MTQPDLFDPGRTYPEAPGYKERTTSRDAARKIEPRVGTLKADILALLRQGGSGTSDEIAEALGKSVLAIRPRVTELYKLGLIERTGAQLANVSGMKAHVFRIARAA